MTAAWARLPGLLVLTLLAACGAAPLGGAPSPTPRPVASGTPAPVADPVRAFIARSQATVQALPGYTTTLKFYQKQGTKVVRGTYDVAGKGSVLRIFILDGNSKGTHLRYEGGPKVKVRPGGFLSPLVLDLDLHDARIMSVRGYSIDQTEMKGFLRMLADPANAIVQARRQDGTAWISVEGPKLLSGCVRLDAEFDERTMIPRVIELRDAKEPVFRLDFQNMKVTAQVDLDI